MAEGTAFPQFIVLREDPSNQQVYDQFVRKMGDTGRRASGELGRAMSGVRDTIAEALSIPRNAGGSLDLNIAQLREMERQSEAVARATREYAIASKQAAIASGENSRARNQEIRAAFELARAEEASLTSLRAKIRVLDQVQTELNQTASATDAVVTATRKGTDAWGIHANSMRGTRQAMVQTGQQLQDVAISLYGGQRASVVFAQQIPQLMFALTSLEGSANKTSAKIGAFATLMSGPWSIAVVAASALLGGLIDKFLLSGDAADKAAKGNLALVDALEKSRIATDAAQQALADYNAEQDKARKSTEDMIALNLASAEARLKDAMAIREQLKAELERAGRAGAGSNVGQGFSGVGVTQASQALEAQDAKIKLLERTILNLGIQDTNRRSDAAADPRKAIQFKYKDQRDQWERDASKQLITLEEYNRRRTKSLKDETAALEAYDKVNRASGRTENMSVAAFGSPLKSGSYTASSGFGVDRGDHKHAGLDMAARTGTPVYATQDGVVGFSGAAGAYGNLIKIGHGGGTETRYGHLSEMLVGKDQQVSKGDLIGRVGSTGRSTGPHLHYEVRVNGKAVDPTKGQYPIDASKVAEEADKARQALQEFGERSAEKISRINEAFDEQPRLIDRANQATRALDDTIAELSEKKPEGWQQLIADAQNAKSTIQDSLVRPFRELREESEQRLDIERLFTAGLEDEARALEIIYGMEKSRGELTAQQKQEILETVRYEREITEELRRRQEITNQYLDATRSVKQELASIFSGTGSFKNLGQIFKNLQGQMIVEKLFGSAFRDFDKWVKGESGLATSVDYFSSETSQAGDAAKDFAAAVRQATANLRTPALGGASTSIGSGIAGLAGLFGGANDNVGPDIVVVGKKGRADSVNELTPERYFAEMSKRVVGPLLNGLDNNFGTKFFGKLNGALSGAMNGYLTGGATGGILGGLQGLFKADSGIGKLLGLGLQGSQTGTLVSGLGNAFGLGLSGTGSQIGGALGSFLPIPGGQIIGSIVGGIIEKTPSLLGGLLGFLGFGGGTKYGAAAVTNSGVTSRSNNGDFGSAATGAGGSIAETISNIASRLGASVGNYAVSIGQTNGNWNVNPNAISGRIGTDWQRDTIDFKKDQEGAIRWAIMNAIQDGAIAGLRASSQVLLRKGADIEVQVEKVLKFEDVFKSLRAIKDPIGAALDELNLWAEQMKTIFAEAGASAEEYAQLEELYGIKRAEAIKQASEAVTASLRSLLDDLTVGNDALSLRERRGSALAAYDPLKARVAAGDSTAYNEFADAARALLDIERQMFGSQSGYFNRLNEVTGLTRGALSAQDALINGSSGAASPFAANDNVVGALGTQTGVLQGGFGSLTAGIAAVNENLGTLIQINLAGGIGVFRFEGVNVANF